MSRAPNLTDAGIRQIVELLDSWVGKLTWERLIEAARARLHVRYTRQALSNHTRIADAFRQRKEALRGANSTADASSQNASPELRVALARIHKLEGENARVTAENERLLIQFAHWLYNAESRGVTKEQLSAPLPATHREPTVFERKDGRSRKRDQA